MDNNELINILDNIEYLPATEEHNHSILDSVKFPFAEMLTLGAGFSSLPQAFRTVTQTVDTGGLYRCVFPEGVTGTLAQFKGSTDNLGTIMNNGKFAGQAHWIPVDSSVMTTTVPFNPATMFMAMALMNIEKKMDNIQETQREILRFLEQDKESRMRGDLNMLVEITEDYKYNWDNSLWCKSKCDLVQSIMRSASGDMDFYQNQIKECMPKKSRVHANRKTDSLAETIDTHFKNYQLSLYLYAFSHFMEIMLTENFKSEYLNKVVQQIDAFSMKYRTLYSECYAELEHFAKSSIETHLLRGIAASSKLAGDTIAKIPLISKSQLDESLIEAGDYIKDFSQRKTDDTMERYINNRYSGIQMFIDNINMINQMHNKPVELLFDSENVYLKLVG